MSGILIAFEGLDQSGKQTQAARLAAAWRAAGRTVRELSFPDYETPIGREIGAALRGEREFAADVMQLLYVANRYEYRPAIEQVLASGGVVVCDRYRASSVGYGEAQGLSRAWLEEIQRYLPPPDLTVLLDIAPATAVDRKATNRDRFERDLALLGRVRESYRRQAAEHGWLLLDGERSKDAVADDILTAVRTRFGLPPAP
jgi:dTMP kinase